MYNECFRGTVLTILTTFLYCLYLQAPSQPSGSVTTNFFGLFFDFVGALDGASDTARYKQRKAEFRLALLADLADSEIRTTKTWPSV